MRKSKRFFATLSITLCLSMIMGMGSVFATENIAKPIPTDKQFDKSTFKRQGNLTDEEMEDTIRNNDCVECIQQRHISIFIHQHYVRDIFNQYIGERENNNGVTCKPINTNSTLLLSKSLNVNNSFNTTISISKGLVEAKVGYDVSKNWNETASYSIAVPKNKNGEIKVFDIYDVKEFNIETITVIDDGPSAPIVEWDTGWAEQWLRFDFRGRVW